MLVLPGAGVAADLPLKARAAKTVYEWTGFYVGGHFGYGDASFGPGTNPLPEQGVVLPHSATGLSGGYQLGYNRQLANRVVLGIEADATFTGPLDGPALARSPVPFNTTLDYVGTVRGRVGYAFDRFMPYVTGGVAWGHTHINVNDADGVTPLFPVGHYQTGWTAGLGLEYAVSGNWTAKAEYEYVDLSRKTYDLSGFGLGSVNVDPRIHLFKLGLNYQFGDTPWMPVVGGKTKLPESDDWNVHAQTTVLPQGYGPIHSPYASPQSLPGGGQFQATWTTTAFLGAKLWDGGEFYFNPELAQGFGLNGTLGLAGFSNGEAQKAGAPFPKIRAQRYYLKQTFGLGGEQEAVEDAPNQLAGKRDIDRVTLIVGRFAVGDFFDGNSYAKDPRADFMNWAMWSSGAYDFPADLPGYTRGAVVELNRKDWAIRAGLFQVPSAPNSDVLTFKTGGSVVEFEERHTLLRAAGQIARRRLRQQRQHRQLPASGGSRCRKSGDSTSTTSSPQPSAPASNTASTSTSSSRSSTTSDCSRGQAGTTARTRSCPSPTSTAACRAACRSRAAVGDGRMIRSASAAPSTASRPRTAIFLPPAAPAS